MPMNDDYTLMNVFTPKDGEVENFIALQLQESKDMLKNASAAGWLNNEMYRSNDGKKVISITRFVNQSAQENWAQTAQFTKHLQTIAPLLSNVTSTSITQIATHQATTKFRLAVIIDSTRSQRFADKPAQWIAQKALTTGNFIIEIINLRDYPLAFFGEPNTSEKQKIAATQFAEKIATFDAYIMTVAEYNHAPTAVLKNAIDHADWRRKPLAMVGYGGVGGARAVEQLRGIAAEMEMMTMQTAVHIVFADYLKIVQENSAINTFPHLEQSADQMLHQLTWWTKTLYHARSLI